MVLHAVCVMSNHHHLVVTDPHGVLPEFLRELHRSTAKALNASQGQWENLWAAEPCSAVVLADDQDILDKIAYTAVNPVAAGLVEQPEQWPGLCVWQPGRTVVERPHVYFADDGPCPAQLTLQVHPPVLRDTSEEGRDYWESRLDAVMRSKIAEAHRKVHAAGRSFLGRAAVLAESFVKRAKSFEPKRVLVPTIAAKDPNARRVLTGLQKAFRMAHRAALRAWRDGLRDVVFPFGTWGMRVFHSAFTAPAPLSG